MVTRHHPLGHRTLFPPRRLHLRPRRQPQGYRCRHFAALEELAPLGEVPILLTGDFNLESHQAPTLHAACTYGGWHDVAALFAQQGRTAPDTTCLARPGAHPRRIDYMLANTVLFSACQDFAVLQDTGLPTHKPRCSSPSRPSTAAPSVS